MIKFFLKYNMYLLVLKLKGIFNMNLKKIIGKIRKI